MQRVTRPTVPWILLLVVLGGGGAYVLLRGAVAEQTVDESSSAVDPSGSVDPQATAERTPSQPPRLGPSAAVPTERVQGVWRFPGVEEVSAAETFERLMDRFSGEDRETLLRYYSELDDAAMVFSSREQYAWLIANGFPGPEDVLAAASTSEEDLRAYAAAGNAKALFFLVGRLADGLAAEREAGRFDREDMLLTDYPDRTWELRELGYQAAASGSPFVGYVLERLGAVSLGPGFDANMRFAGLHFASAMGDPRAIWSTQHIQGVDTGSVLITFGELQARAMERNPQMRRSPQTPFPIDSVTGNLYSAKKYPQSR
jgi:hypothetical protein